MFEEVIDVIVNLQQNSKAAELPDTKTIIDITLDRPV